MTERRDIPDALRDAVERTVRATLGTRELAQGAASELSGSVDELVKGAEKSLTRSGRTVRAAVEERLPATQEDVKAIRAELRRIGKRLELLEERLGDAPAPRPGRSRTARTTAKAGATAKARTPAKARTAAKPKTTSKAKPRSASRTGTRAKPQR